MGEDAEVPTPPEGIGLAEGVPGAEKALSELAPEEAESRLERLPGWSLADDARAVEATFSFGGPGDALAAVALLAGTARVRGWSASLELSESRVRVRFRSIATARVSAAELLAAREVSQTLQRLGADVDLR